MERIYFLELIFNLLLKLYYCKTKKKKKYIKRRYNVEDIFITF